MTLTAGFEAGSNAATIATTDAGNDTAWDTVTIPAGGGAIYDNTHAHSGLLAGKVTGGTGNATTLLEWGTALGQATKLDLRNGIAAYSLWIDDVAAGATAYPGPFNLPPVPTMISMAAVQRAANW